MRSVTRATIAALAGLALFAAPLAYAQEMPGIGPGFFQTAFSLPASNTGSVGMAQSINCVIFGILDNLGIMRNAGSGCTPIPPPGDNGGGNGGGGNDGGGGHGTTTPRRATLSVVNFVSGGTTTPDMFTIHVSGGHPNPEVFDGSNAGTDVRIDSGTPYSVSVDAMMNYLSSYSPGCSGTLSPGTFRTCVVTNTFQTPTSTPTTTPQTGAIRLMKMVSAGTGTTTATSSDFMLHLKNASTSAEVSSSPHAGSATGTTYSGLPFGIYMVWETGASTSSFTPTFSGDCSSDGMITLSSSTTRNCTLTNTLKTQATSTASSTPMGTITVIKKVTGSGMNVASSSAFMLHLKNASTSAEISGSPQMGSATGTKYMNLPAGSYMVSETGGPTGYTASWSGDCDSTGMIMLTGSSSKTCTVTNKQPTGSLKVIKMVTGTNASTTNATSSDFMIHVWSLSSTSTNATSTEITGSPQMGSATGTTFITLPLGNYRVTETGAATSNYTPTWSGDCDANGFVTIWGTGLKSCTLTNAWMGTTTATTTSSASTTAMTASTTAQTSTSTDTSSTTENTSF
jgi:hypothetical protein